MIDALGKVQSILILGATSDIGQAIAARLARPGSRVVLAARSPEHCAAFAATLVERGVAVETVTFDADDPASHRGVLELAAAGGDLDVVVFAWGVLGAPQELLDNDPVGAAALACTNYQGAVSAGLETARVLRAQGHGTIVALSSVAGERVRAANYVYGSSKAGADAFFQGLADAVVGTGVRVLVVRPGFVHSKMTAGLKPAPMATTPDAVAQATVAALGGRAGTIWVPGVLRWVFMVMRHLPRPVWRKIPG